MDGRNRVIIESISPTVDDGRFPAKRIVGDPVIIEADIFADSHDQLAAVIRYRHSSEKSFRESSMRHIQNDRWRGEFLADRIGTYYFTIEAWIDRFATWQQDFKKRVTAGQQVDVDLQIGANLVSKAASRAQGPAAKELVRFAEMLITNHETGDAVSAAMSEELRLLMQSWPETATATRVEKEYPITVDRTLAGFSSWYELFPRSCDNGAHGTFLDCIQRIPAIRNMGFDILYLPPIHPIGTTNRKGRNNVVGATENDPGSPWAIGSRQGGHKSVNPSLGSMDDFEKLVAAANSEGIEIALDIAFQCSPDHPYVHEHPEWFVTRPDGTIQYAENPPKKYEDIVPFNFETEHWEALWNELKSVLEFWIEKGISVFRVDNPHTKSFPFWQWVIPEIKSEHPAVIFLAEAFTRPKVMYRLAKAGFSQSYTYFTWRNTKWELESYLAELTSSPVQEFFRPNFWPNTPDILPQFLQYGGRPAFVLRLLLAATLSSNYGIYGPAYEHTVATGWEGKEEYADSEKYEIKQWDWNKEGSLAELISRVNEIRRKNPALHRTLPLRFVPTDNDMVIAFAKYTIPKDNLILTVANLDPFHTQSAWVTIPLGEFGIEEGRPFLAHDLIMNTHFIWQGSRNYVQMNPGIMPAHVFHLRSRLRREFDFDYFM